MTDPDAPITVKRGGGRFGIVYAHVVTDPALTAQAVRAYAVLATHADAAREAYPTRKLLAKGLNASLDTLDRALKCLERAGHLVITERIGDKGEQRSSDYLLTDMQQPPGGRTGAEGGSRTGAEGGGRTGAAHNKTTGEQTTGNIDAAAPPGPPDALFAIDGEARPGKDEATVLAEWWWSRQDPKPAGKSAWWATLNTVRAVLKAGHTPHDVGEALKATHPPLTVARLEIALNGRKTKTAMAVTDWKERTTW